LVAYPRFQIPLNPPFLKGEISHNDLDETTIKTAKIYKTGGLEIKDTLRKCQQKNEGCQNRYVVIGGMEGEPRDGGPIPAVLDRFPFESCEDTGFRTVMGLAEKK